MEMDIVEILKSGTPKEVRDRAAALLTHLATYFKDKRVSEIIIVPMILMARVIRTHDAISMLSDNKFYAEAAILLITELDLRLDLAFISHKPKNATLWMSHDDTKWPVSNTSRKINTLFGSDEIRDRMIEIYTYLSGIKHANPAHGMLGFPVEVNGPNLSISTGEIDNDFTEQFGNYIRAHSLYQLAWSAQVLNVYPIRYTVIKKEPREKVLLLARKLEPVEEMFREFMHRTLTQPPGPFGVRRKRMEKEA
jgi:hypothetical protein